MRAPASDARTSVLPPARRWRRARGALAHWVRHSGLLRPVTIKVLAFAAACLVVLVALAARIGNVSLFSHRVAYSAVLADATGLQPSDAVKIAGVTVGQVDSVAVDKGHALVRFSVNRNVHLPADTEVGLRWHNVIGQQFLYLYPGRSASMLRPGARIPLSHTVAGADIGALLNSLGPLLGALHPAQANQVVEAIASALQGNEAQVDALISNAATVSQTVGSVDAQVGQVIDDLHQVLGALAARSGDLGSVIDNLQSLSQTLASRNDLLDQTVANLGEVAGEVATLEGDTHGSLSSAIADLQAVSADIESHASQLSQGLSTLGAGLAPYTEISSYGQWFQIQTVYSCLANETVCTYYQATNAPAGAGPLGAPPASGLPTPAGSDHPLGVLPAVPTGSGSAAAPVPALGGFLQMLAGSGPTVGLAP